MNSARNHLNQKDLKSATIHAAPVIRKVRANSDQFRCAFGRAIRRGIQTITPKSASMSVIKRIAIRAWRLMRMAIAASANAIVVSTRPKHLVGQNPLWNQVSRQTKIDHLTERK